MREKKFIYRLAFSTAGIFLLCLFLINFSGCSAVGFGVGSLIDNSRPDYSPVKEGRLADVGNGRNIIVELNDSTRIAAKYVGLVKDTGDDYRQRYSGVRAKLADDIVLPHIGDTADFAYASGTRLKGIFEGFDQNFPCSPCSTFVDVKPLIGESPFREKLCFLSYMHKSSGDSVKTGEICNLIGEGKIPLMSQIALVDDGELEKYPLEDVRKVQLKNRKFAKWIGLGMGLAIDACLVAIAISLNNMEIFGDASWGG